MTRPMPTIRKKTRVRETMKPVVATEEHVEVPLPKFRGEKETISAAARRMGTTRTNLQALHEQGRLMWGKDGRIKVVRMPVDDKKEDLRDEQTLRVREHVKRLRIANAKELGQLVSAKDVEKNLRNLLALFRQRLLAFPRRLSGRLVSLTDKEIEDTLNSEIADLIESLGKDAKKVVTTE